MSLSASERREIEEIVRVVFKEEFCIVGKEIAAASAEIIDWYTSNLADIFVSRNSQQETWASEFRAKLDRMLDGPERKSVTGFKP